jgi:nucleotide-binding universal stress UspA family protein
MEVPKISVKKILYPTDLSETGRRAFAYAASLANLYGADLTVFHVLEEGPELDPRLVGYVSDELWEEIKQRDVKEATEMLIRRRRDDAAIRDCVGAFCEKAQFGVPEEAYVTYDIDVALGQPVPEIVRKAREGSYDLIVLGSHGHSTLVEAMEFMIGDTARNVLRRSRVPVVVVPLPRAPG